MLAGKSQLEASSPRPIPSQHVEAPTAATQHSWAGISNYYLWSCNSTVRTEALNAVRAAGLRVVRVFLVSTTGAGAVAACADTPTPDLEPTAVGSYDNTILERLDQLMYEAKREMYADAQCSHGSLSARSATRSSSSPPRFFRRLSTENLTAEQGSFASPRASCAVTRPLRREGGFEPDSNRTAEELRLVRGWGCSRRAPVLGRG